MALIGDASIEAAVGNDVPTLCKGWQYKGGEMLGTVGLKEKGFGQWSDVQFGTIEQEVAYLDAERCAAGFASSDIRDVTGGKPLFEQCHLGGFACSIKTFKRD